jgi:glycosyltransferase involved in cell wall biosynthesis
LSADKGVLVIIETLGAGGAEWALVNLAGELKQRVGCLEVAVLHPPYTLQPQLESQGIPVHRLSISNPWYVWSGVARLRLLLKTRRFRIVHGHLFFGALHGSIAGSLSGGIVRVASFHNLGYASYPPKSVPQHARKMLDRLTMGHLVDGFLAVSNAVAAHYSDHLGLREVTVVPNALSQDLVDGALDVSPNRRRTATSHPTIVMPGRFVPEKGHAVLLQAVSRLEPEYPGITVVLAGSGPLENEIRSEAAELGLAARVRFSGTVSREELFEMEREADLVAVPSLYEGFGLAAAEAMALGTTVVASDAGGLRELINDSVTGRLARAGSVEELASVIRSVLSDKRAAATMEVAARTYVAEHFAPGLVADQTVTFYDRLHRGGQGRARRTGRSAS